MNKNLHNIFGGKMERNKINVSELEFYLMLEALDDYHMYWKMINSRCNNDENKKILNSINTLQTKISYSYLITKSDTINITDDELYYLYRAMFLYLYNKNNKYLSETNKIIDNLKSLLVNVKGKEI
jgi:hypothetical protein